MAMNFYHLLNRVVANRKRKLDDLPDMLVAIDPGETTGFAVFYKREMIACGQLETKDVQNLALEIYAFLSHYFDNKSLRPYNKGLLVYEDYKVYATHIKQHTMSKLHTPKLIGMFETAAQLLSVPTDKMMASEVKTFCSDQKLREWGFWQKSAHRHANDAIRHATYYLLFKG